MLTQALKRSPANLRCLALIPKTQNPKALALFLSALLKLANAGVIDRDDLIKLMIDRLTALRSARYPHCVADIALPECEQNVRRGFDFYQVHFFREDGAARYLHDRTYPIDIHCVGKTILTLIEFCDPGVGIIELVNSGFQWAIQYMRNEREFFYCRALRACTIRASYVRWSQAWMLLVLSTLLVDSNSARRNLTTADSAAVVRSR